MYILGFCSELFTAPFSFALPRSAFTGCFYSVDTAATGACFPFAAGGGAFSLTSSYFLYSIMIWSASAFRLMGLRMNPIFEKY